MVFSAELRKRTSNINSNSPMEFSNWLFAGKHSSQRPHQFSIWTLMTIQWHHSRNIAIVFHRCPLLVTLCNSCNSSSCTFRFHNQLYAYLLSLLSHFLLITSLSITRKFQVVRYNITVDNRLNSFVLSCISFVFQFKYCSNIAVSSLFFCQGYRIPSLIRIKTFLCSSENQFQHFVSV